MNRVSLVAQMVKNLLAVQETQIQPLGQEDPLEKGMATHSGIFAWNPGQNPMDRGAWRSTVHGVARVGHNLATKPPKPGKGLRI